MTTVKPLYSLGWPQADAQVRMGTMTPRRLTTPLTKGGAWATRVGAS